MIVIRLKRMGKKKHPFYRIVVAEKARPVAGKFIEIIGTFDPLTKPEKIQINKERLQLWLKRGAQLSDTLNNLLVKAGELPKTAIIKKTTAKKKEKEKEEKPEKPAVIPVPKAQQEPKGESVLEEIEEEIKEEPKAPEEAKPEIPAEKIETKPEIQKEEKSEAEIQAEKPSKPEDIKKE